MEHDLSDLQRPGRDLMQLLRNPGRHVDRVMADALRRLETDTLKDVRIFSQRVVQPWNPESGFTTQLAYCALRRELEDDRGLLGGESRERVRQAIAVINDEVKMGVAAVVQSSTAAILYWNWAYG